MTAIALADQAVLVEKAGTIVALPGGSAVSEGHLVDSASRIRVRPGEHAVFLFRNGNRVRLDCDGYPAPQAADLHDRGLLVRILASFSLTAPTHRSRACGK